LNSQLKLELPKILPLNEATAVIQSSEYVNGNLPKEYLADTLKIYVDALQLIWYVLIPMSSLGFISSFFVVHHDTRKPGPVKKDAAVEDGEKAKEETIVLEIPASNDDAVRDEIQARQVIETASSSKSEQELADKKPEVA
jgi:hypothetical protein